MGNDMRRGYLRPRYAYVYDPAIDRMSDRIDELETEIVRLRAAGDALVGALENNMMATAVVLVNRWKEVRHC